MGGKIMFEIDKDKILAIYDDIIKKKTRNKERIYKFDRYKMMNIDKVYKELKNCHYDVVIGGYKRVVDDKVKFILTLKDEEFSKYIVTGPYCRIIKKSFLEKK